jgi:hypothetical protein
MTITFKKIGLIVLWAASLMLVAQWGHTQTPKNLPTPAGMVISGNDIGFRFEGLSAGGATGLGATGVWMVKVNGAWMPVTSPATSKPLAAK